MSRKFSLSTAAALALSLCAGPAVAQKMGGVLKFATPSVKPGLDPARTSTGDGYMLNAMIFSNLTRVSHELKAEPQLAHSWEANADSSEWTFHLVKNAKFTNGRPVTAHDVKFSFERILDPETASRGRKAMGPIDTITAVDDHTLVIKLAGPYADLPLQLGNTFARVLAEENLEELSHNPIGSGPFILTEYIPGNKAILVKNPDYFEEGLPYLDEVHQIYIKEYAAQVSALTTGEIDIMYFAPSEIISQLEADPNIEVRITPAPSFQPLVMFVEQTPFSDARVRQAVRLAIDREAMLEAATSGLGSVLQSGGRRAPDQGTFAGQLRRTQAALRPRSGDPLPRGADGGAVLQELRLRGAQGGQELQADSRPVRGSARHLGREIGESGPESRRGPPGPRPIRVRLGCASA